MAIAPRAIAPLLALMVTLIISAARADSDGQLTLENIQTALAGVRIFGGPDASKLTRSPWGPELYRNSVDGVVLVYVPDKGGPGRAALGSGALVSATCHVLTNWHVVEEKKRVAIIFRPLPPKTLESLTENEVFAARVLKTSQPQDLALLQMERCPSGVRSLQLENAEQIEVGQDVFAIGHPEGLHWTYTEGVISQIRPAHRWESEGKKFSATIIQTQTAVSYGSSGGPLINRAGRVVGIISTALGERAGFNLAISSHELRSFLSR